MPEQYRAAVTLADWGTLRREEVLGLNREDVDLRAGTIRVKRSLHEFYDGRLLLGPTKNGNPRKVYMPSSVMPALEDHLRRFVGPEGDAPLFPRCPGAPAASEQLRGHLGDRTTAGRPQVVRFHDLRHFAATMFASTGASTKEIMSRGGWKSVAMVVRYEHASEERDAFLAQALNQFAEPSNVVSITNASPGDRARSAHDDRETDESEGEVFDLDPVIRDNEEECSGGETRTHNLAVNSRLLCH